MRYQTIQSDANAKFKRWKKLADNTRFIKKEGATLAEGAHLVLTLSERKIIPAALISFKYFLSIFSGFNSMVTSVCSEKLKHDKILEISEDFNMEGVPPPKYKVLSCSFL